MPDKSSPIEKLLMQRLDLVGKLSQATAEHMRILQMSSGIDVLLMQQPDSPERIQKRSEAENRISSSQSTLESLESSLAVIDKAIESTLNMEV